MEKQRSHIKLVTVAATAIGADDILVIGTVPTGCKWRFICGQIIVVTDGTVATRNPVVRFKSGTAVVYETSIDPDVAASQTVPINLNVGPSGADGSSGSTVGPTVRNNTGWKNLPGGLLSSGMVIDVFVVTGANADTVAAELLVEESIDHAAQ